MIDNMTINWGSISWYDTIRIKLGKVECTSLLNETVTSSVATPSQPINDYYKSKVTNVSFDYMTQ